MKILIVGGAGYIGSHMNKLASERGHETIVFDNLVYGHREAVKWGRFIEGDLKDEALLDRVFSENEIDAVMHFSAYAYVGESVTEPAKYYRNNVSNTVHLLDAMRAHEVKFFIFSSTCATYGEPKTVPITEEVPQHPVNPYGRSKYMVEQLLEDYHRAYGLQYAALRYFNAAGDDPEAQIGEMHDPETHLIPLVLDAALKRREHITVFGTDYDTPDGTCIRDYIHVLDLADAHLRALEYIMAHDCSERFNLANGKGYSVKEIIETAKKVSGKEIKVVFSDRRAGDPPVLVGSAKKAEELLGWKPAYDLTAIMEHAWKWQQKMSFS